MIKVKFSPCLTKHHALKLYILLNKAPHHAGVLGSGGIVPLILNLGTSGGEHSTSCPSCFTPRGKRPPYPLNRRLHGPRAGVLCIF
jgi:hypothetical protein